MPSVQLASTVPRVSSTRPRGRVGTGAPALGRVMDRRQQLGPLAPLPLAGTGDGGSAPFPLVELADRLDLAAIGTDGPVQGRDLARARDGGEGGAELARHRL